MQLERIEISGFRGIKRLSLHFDELTTLLGENTWGKSSLLDALEIILPSTGQLYPFELRDFHVDYALEQQQSQHIQIITHWRASHSDEHKNGRYRRLKPIWLDGETKNAAKHFIFQVCATRSGKEIESHCHFLNLQGEQLKLHNCAELALELSTLHPVIRLRDARRLHWHEPKDPPHHQAKNQAGNGNDHNTENGNHKPTHHSLSYNERIEKRINNTYRRLIAMPGHVNKAEIKSSLNSMQKLIEHYFSFKVRPSTNIPSYREGLFSDRTNNADGEQATLVDIINRGSNQQSKLLLMGLLNAYLQAKGASHLRRGARPILVLEDPEGRLHPTNLLKSWQLLQLIPMQKILTTNSSVLLSAVPLHSIRRLVRQSGRTIALFVAKNKLSQDEMRRISFHIRFHRPNALFARCWLLVEGETEVWLFNELAKISGYNLAAEGVQLIEFAQSGLKSLIKLAKALNIDWHVVVDGDAAGKKYANNVRSLLGKDLEKHRLTELPDRDIEHFLYNHGFEMYFRNLIKINADQPIPTKKIITRALKKHAKPDVALGIVEYCEQGGVEQVPLLLRWIIKRVITMANGNT